MKKYLNQVNYTLYLVQKKVLLQAPKPKKKNTIINLKMIRESKIRTINEKQ